MATTIRAIIFDLDGVLVDACDWHYEALNRALVEVANTEISREEHETTFNGLPTKNKLNTLVRMGRIQEENIEEINKLKQKFTLRIIKEKDLYPPRCEGERPQRGRLRNDKLITLMKTLKANGIKVACVTNCIAESAYEMLSAVGVYHDMTTVVTSNQVKNAKPHPEGYWDAMSCLGVLPEQTIIVEDSLKGRLAAKRSGAHLFAVDNPSDVTWLRIAEKIMSCE